MNVLTFLLRLTLGRTKSLGRQICLLMNCHHISYVIINMGGVIAINHFAANQCLHRPAIKCSTSESHACCCIAQCCLQNRRQSCCWKAIRCLPISAHLRMSVWVPQTWLHINDKQVFQNCGRGTATKVVRSKPDWPDQWLWACVQVD